jgi:hypothetical protein
VLRIRRASWGVAGPPKFSITCKVRFQPRSKAKYIRVAGAVGLHHIGSVRREVSFGCLLIRFSIRDVWNKFASLLSPKDFKFSPLLQPMIQLEVSLRKARDGSLLFCGFSFPVLTSRPHCRCKTPMFRRMDMARLSGHVGFEFLSSHM